MAIRVPTPDVSLVDLTFTARPRHLSVEEINQPPSTAAAARTAELACSTTTVEPLVSSDLTSGTTAQHLRDSTCTQHARWSAAPW